MKSPENSTFGALEIKLLSRHALVLILVQPICRSYQSAFVPKAAIYPGGAFKTRIKRSSTGWSCT